MPRVIKRRQWVLTILLHVPLFLLIPLIAYAQPGEVIEGIVIDFKGGEVIIDLGRKDGLSDGAELQVFRRLEVKHPVTNKTIVDRFSTGALKLEQVGQSLSVTADIASLARPPRPGDFVVYYPSPPSTQGPVEPVAETDSDDPARADVEEAFSQTLGKPIDVRIAVWEAYLNAHQASPFAERIGQELTWLRNTLAKARRAAEEPAAAAQAQPVVERLDATVASLKSVTRGQVAMVVATLTEPDKVQSVRLLVRKKSATYFETFEMGRNGDTTWSANVNPELLDESRVDYFVEAVRANGEIEPLKGNAGKPRTLLVKEPVLDPLPLVDRSLALTTFEYVDFKMGEGDDAFVRFESDYRYTISERGKLKAIRVGVGIFSGDGGSLAEVERGESRSLNTSYGFTELEFQLSPLVGASARLLVGDQSTDEDAPFSGVFGVHGELRLGRFDQTRLELGASLTDGIGSEGWIELWIEAIEDVTMLGEVVVTNLPVGEDLGVSLNYGIGYEIVEGFTPMLQVGWNARTINHTGFSAGVSTALSW